MTGWNPSNWEYHCLSFSSETRKSVLWSDRLPACLPSYSESKDKDSRSLQNGQNISTSVWTSETWQLNTHIDFPNTHFSIDPNSPHQYNYSKGLCKLITYDRAWGNRRQICAEQWRLSGWVKLLHIRVLTKENRCWCCTFIMARYLLCRCAWRTVPAATWGAAVQHQCWACPQRHSHYKMQWGTAVQHQCWACPQRYSHYKTQWGTAVQHQRWACPQRHSHYKTQWGLQHATWGAAIQHQCWAFPQRHSHYKTQWGTAVHYQCWACPQRHSHYKTQWGTAVQHQCWACPQRYSHYKTRGIAVQHQRWACPQRHSHYNMQHEALPFSTSAGPAHKDTVITKCNMRCCHSASALSLPTKTQSLQNARFETLTVVLPTIHLLAQGPVSMCEWLLTFQRYCVPLSVTEVTVTQCFKMLFTTHPITQHDILEDFNPRCNT